MTGVSFIASESGIPLAAETIFTIGNFGITNAMLLGMLVAVGLIIVFLAMAKYISVRPRSKFALFMESVVLFVVNNIKVSLGGDDKKARKFLALYLAFFLFILINNLFGLFPGMGGAVYLEEEGVKAALLRPFTTDLNGTLALAIIAIVTVQYFAIKERGLWGHIKHYYTIMTPWYNPINFFVGSIEVLGELIRLLTLALRLFGVIYAGEVLLHVISGLSGPFAPLATLPIVFMEIFFSAIQAYLFLMLSATYLAIGTAHDEQHNDTHATVAKQKSVADTA